MRCHTRLPRRVRAVVPARRALSAMAGAVACALVAGVIAVGASPASAVASATAAPRETAASDPAASDPAASETAEPETPIESDAAHPPVTTHSPQAQPSPPASDVSDEDAVRAEEVPPSTEPAAPSGAEESVAPEAPVEPAAHGPPHRMARAAADVSILAAGAPEAPVEVWREDFEGVAGTAPVQLGQYPTAASPRYTASPYWLSYANCNGVLLRYTTSFAGTAQFCDASDATADALSQRQVRRMADVLGQVNAGVVGGTADNAPTTTGSTATTQSNRGVAAMTMSGTAPAGETTVFESRSAVGVAPAPTASRYYAMSIDVAEDSCAALSGANNSRLSLALLAGAAATPRSLTASPIVACAVTGGRYTSPTIIAGTQAANFGSSASVRAGRFTTDSAVLLSAAEAASARVRVSNSVLASGGNDFSFDNVALLDATPSLDKAFSPAAVATGAPSTLTFTVTNTSELAAKPDWSFTDALPAGLVVASAPAVGGTCANATGSAFAVQAAAAGSTITATGGDLATGVASCTVTVNVVAAAPGSYTNGPDNVTTVLNAPEAATLEVEAPTTLTIQKNVAGRALPADQFRLALSSGTSELASATTAGPATGIQSQRVGPVNVTRGETYTISENVVSSSALNAYETGYTCVRGGVTIATGTSLAGSITIPDEPGASILCTFTNTPQPATLYCDGSYFYAVRANGSIAQVNSASTAAPTQLIGAVTSVTDANALGINDDGSAAFALDRRANDANVGSVISYATASGTLQATRTVLTTAQGALQDRNGAALAGTIIAGAVDPLTGRYVVGKSAAGFVRLWEYTPEATAGSRFLYLGQVATGTNAVENGDIAFDEQGNLHVVLAAADSSSVGTFTVPRQTFLAATGGTLAANATTRRALSGTDTGFALTSVNGIAFSPRGTVYLGNATVAYSFDPTTWARVPGSTRATIGTTAAGAGASDLAACASPATVSLEKNVVGRLNTNDQFRVVLSAGSPLTESAVATTTGTATGLQSARIGPNPVQIDTSVTIAETMAPGSASPLTAYTSVYECWADGVRISTGSQKTAAITIPNRLSVGVACTFTNSPQPVATVRVSKFVEGWDGADRAAAPGWTVTTTVVAGPGSTATSLPSRNPSQLTGADGAATWQVLFGAATHRARVTVAETAQAGYRYQSLVCTLDGAAAATTVTTVTTVETQVRGSVNVDIAPGSTLVCAFTNRPVASLTLAKNVSFGSASPSEWNLGATGPTGALAGPSGRAGSPQVTAVQVSSGAAYRLAETGGTLLYVQAGSWRCSDASGAPVAVSAAGDVTLDPGAAVTCTATNATASMTILKHVEGARPGFAARDWLITATPAALAGGPLPTEARVGAEYSAAGNPASTFDVRPGHGYTLSEDVTDPNSRIAYRLVRIERLTGTTWTPVASASITAPAPGQTAVYRFVNAPVEPTTLPLTGGTSADSFLIAGSSVLILALALAVAHSWRRSWRRPE